MPSGPVILNNTPLVSLWVLGQLDLLRSLYGEVLIPTAVLAEFIAVEAPLRQQALERGVRLVVIDERKGRSFARRLMLSLTGTLGVLLAAQQRGLITDLELSITALQAAGLYFQPSLISRVLELARGNV